MLAFTAIMYSAYVVDNAKYFCNLVYEDTSLPAKIMAYPDVDHLVSTSADMSELVKPSNRGLLELKRRHTLEVPFMYQSIHLTVAQWYVPGLLMN